MLECCFVVEEDGDDGSRTLWEMSSIRLSTSWRCLGCLRRSHEGVEMRSLLGAAEQTCPITPTASASLSQRALLAAVDQRNLLSAAT
jgi:hypothetical protein